MKPEPQKKGPETKPEPPTHAWGLQATDTGWNLYRYVIDGDRIIARTKVCGPDIRVLAQGRLIAEIETFGT